ncbi:MAG TPA: ABC transporter ATP-binding protein [Terriglobales bacterium]|nr:ABC transporter ATP-binding protein [Terriglobales bacterium]
MIDVRGVTKSFPTRDAGRGLAAVHALREVDVQIGSHEFFTLLGPSGCGKTTLLRLIGGFEMPSAGAILIDGKDVAALPPQKRPVNTVFQNYALFPHMTVAENVAFGLEMCGWAPADIEARVREALDMVRLTSFANRKPNQMSGGQQQRVALARALAPKPSVLLLDEPLSALDLKLRKEMQAELKRLQRETGITFVLVTHDQEEALAMSDRIAVMRDGKILQIGSPADIYDNPNCRFVADFIGEANLIPGSVLGRSSALTVAVRPERVTLAACGDVSNYRSSGTVAAVTFLGLDTLYEVTLQSEIRLRVRIRDRQAAFQPGDAVAVGWPQHVERELLQ